MKKISYSSGWHRDKRGYPKNQFGSKYKKKYGKRAQDVFKKRYKPDKFKRYISRYKR